MRPCHARNASSLASRPARIDAARARGLGLLPDADFESIIREYVSENPNAAALAVQP